MLSDSPSRFGSALVEDEGLVSGRACSARSSAQGELPALLFARGARPGSPCRLPASRAIVSRSRGDFFEPSILNHETCATSAGLLQTNMMANLSPIKWPYGSLGAPKAVRVNFGGFLWPLQALFATPRSLPTSGRCWRASRPPEALVGGRAIISHAWWPRKGVGRSRGGVFSRFCRQGGAEAFRGSASQGPTEGYINRGVRC